jgi:hypothetical protein
MDKGPGQNMESKACSLLPPEALDERPSRCRTTDARRLESDVANMPLCTGPIGTGFERIAASLPEMLDQPVLIVKRQLACE